jgi:hypothetical protein
MRYVGAPTRNGSGMGAFRAMRAHVQNLITYHTRGRFAMTACGELWRKTVWSVIRRRGDSQDATNLRTWGAAVLRPYEEMAAQMSARRHFEN